ncbi:hypothetical protein SSX86_013370 [Deinandra increscens subsp. villosa]|uniref:RRM domain-containing protein n=1 Tax=Deinandra increscens subsp. villosa TaxID=3103831 RepID=A0AAP0H1Q3_9ASTR
MRGKGRVGNSTDADGEWQTVQRRKIGNRLTHSFFITGFPENVTTEDLWKGVSHLGEVSDAFIAGKRRYNNERFGFLRFNNVKDVKCLESGLNDVVFDGKKLEANFTQVPRPPVKSKGDTGIRRGYSFPSKSVGVRNLSFKTSGDARTFRDVILGKKVVGSAQSLEARVPSSKWKNITIPDEAESYPSTFYGRTLLGEALDGPSLCNIKLLLNEGGGSDFDVVYAGGLHVLLVFNNKTNAMEFHDSKKQWWLKYFSSLCLWEGQSFPRWRIVGLRILGVPLHLRDDITYDEIAKGFGKIIWPSNSSWMLEDCSGGSVHVISESWKSIEETILITWKETCYTVFVKEDSSPWIPTFIEEEVVPPNTASPEFQSEEVAGEEFWDEGEDHEQERPERTFGLQGLGGGAFLDKGNDGSWLVIDKADAFQNVRRQGDVSLEVNESTNREKSGEYVCNIGLETLEGPHEKDISPVTRLSPNFNMELSAQSAPHPLLPDLNGRHRISCLCIQESKVSNIDRLPIHSIWGNRNCQWDWVPAIGASGGIITLWDPSTFSLRNSSKH